MKNMRAARRYAQALFLAAVEREQEQVVLDDLSRAAETLRSLPDARAIFTQPLFADRMKQGLVDRVFGQVVSPMVCDFLHILVAHDRGDLIDEIVDRYTDLKNAQEGVLPAHITVAVPLGDADLAELVAALTAHSGKRVVPSVLVDDGVIGGVVVRMGDEVIDGSVRGGLRRLRDRLRSVDIAREMGHITLPVTEADDTHV